MNKSNCLQSTSTENVNNCVLFSIDSEYLQIPFIVSGVRRYYHQSTETPGAVLADTGPSDTCLVVIKS